MDTTILTHPVGQGKIPLPPTREKCRARIIQLQSDIAAIRNDIATADLERQAYGGRVEPSWFHRARTALRFKREELALVQEHLRTLPGGAAELKARLKECIIATVRSDYSDEQWRRVIDQANSLLLSQGGA